MRLPARQVLFQLMQPSYVSGASVLVALESVLRLPLLAGRRQQLTWAFSVFAAWARSAAESEAPLVGHRLTPGRPPPEWQPPDLQQQLALCAPAVLVCAGQSCRSEDCLWQASDCMKSLTHLPLQVAQLLRTISHYNSAEKVYATSGINTGGPACPAALAATPSQLSSQPAGQLPPTVCAWKLSARSSPCAACPAPLPVPSCCCSMAPTLPAVASWPPSSAALVSSASASACACRPYARLSGICNALGASPATAASACGSAYMTPASLKGTCTALEAGRQAQHWDPEATAEAEDGPNQRDAVHTQLASEWVLQL